MATEVIVALLAFAGTVLGSLFGVLATGKLTAYRLKKLEEKVDKHNSVIERTYILEEQMKAAGHRISDLERHEEERKEGSQWKSWNT